MFARLDPWRSEHLYEILSLLFVSNKTEKMALVVFEAHGVTFPNGEPVETYVKELSPIALERLEEMTYFQERAAMDRYMNMYNEYYAGATKCFSALTFASKSFTKEFKDEYQEGDDIEDLEVSHAREILHFLFVYYFSYHEAEVQGNEKIKIKSFARWFDNLRKKLGRKMQKKMEAKEKAFNRLSDKGQRDYVRRLNEGARQWKQYWRSNSSATLVRQFNEAKHVATMGNISTMHWSKVFKIDSRRLQATGAGKVQKDVRARCRRWSVFFHADKNLVLGSIFRNRLIERLQQLQTKKEQMEKWFDSLAITVD